MARDCLAAMGTIGMPMAVLPAPMGTEVRAHFALGSTDSGLATVLLRRLRRRQKKVGGADKANRKFFGSLLRE